MIEALSIWRHGPCLPDWNMAWDEALMNGAPLHSCPVLRFYGWSQPAASFGYFQRFDEVRKLTPLRPLLRRPTGGGLVSHENDWTYSVVFPAGHGWHRLHARESYRQLHDWMARALKRLGCAAALATESQKTAPGQCFAGHDQFDVIAHNRKIAGAAQRRNRLGLLIQGSVRPDRAWSRQDWETAVTEEAAQAWHTHRLAFQPSAELTQEAQGLVLAKYARADYHERR